MKLYYQWLIIVALATLLFILHTYGGTGCSKPAAAIKINRPPRLILVKPRGKPSPERTSTPPSEVKSAPVPEVPNTPPSKQRRKRRLKLTKRQKESFARRLSQAMDDPEWVFIQQGS